MNHLICLIYIVLQIQLLVLAQGLASDYLVYSLRTHGCNEAKCNREFMADSKCVFFVLHFGWYNELDN